MVIYLDENTIIGAKSSHRPMKGRTASGYGKNLPTDLMVMLSNKRWYRVKAICYSNATSHYITIGNGFGDRYLDDACIDRAREVMIR